MSICSSSSRTSSQMSASSDYSARSSDLSSDNQFLSDKDQLVKGVAFDAVLAGKPASDTEDAKEKIRFNLEEHGQTSSQFYTIVTWNGRRYRIIVHKDRKILSYSRKDWGCVEDKMIQLWNEAHPEQHFSNGTLKLNAKTEKKWEVTFNNPTHVQRSKAKNIIKKIKDLFEKELTPLNTSSSPKSSTKKDASLQPPIQENPKRSIEKIKNFFLSLLDRIRSLRPLDPIKSCFSQHKDSEEFNSDISTTDDSTSLGGASSIRDNDHLTREINISPPESESDDILNDPGDQYQI